MTECESAEQLSATHQFVLVLRLTVDADGKVTGEVVDPVSERRQRVVGVARLIEAVHTWIGDALEITIRDMSQLLRAPVDQTRPRRR